MVKKSLLAVLTVAASLSLLNWGSPYAKAEKQIAMLPFIERENTNAIYTKEMKTLEKKVNIVFIKQLNPSYNGFKYEEEITKIIENAKIFQINPEILMAIRMSEDGKKSKEYGVLPGWKTIKKYKEETGYATNTGFYFYKDEKEKQMHWSAKVVGNCLKQFKKEGFRIKKDFISYLADIYAPIGTKNDPKGLNKNWERNVRHYYNQFISKTY
jgi:hypothetical protein